MAEQLDLTVPVVLTRSAMTVQALELNWSAQTITVRLAGSDGSSLVATWTGAQAAALMTGLNSANLAAKSLVKRIYEQLVTDGKVPAGTVSGTPS